jgi:hypothetical protein
MTAALVTQHRLVGGGTNIQEHQLYCHAISVKDVTSLLKKCDSVLGLTSVKSSMGKNCM